MRPEYDRNMVLYGKMLNVRLFALHSYFGFIYLPVNYKCFYRHTHGHNSSIVFSSTDCNTITAGEMQALFPNVYSKMSVPKLLDGSSNTMSCSLYFRYPEMISAIDFEQESTAVFSTGNVINKIEIIFLKRCHC